MVKLINYILKRLSALFLLLIMFCGEAGAARPFIIDTDVGVDDVIAILYLLQRPDINIKAITIASTGNAHCVPALRNMLGILKMMNRSNIPVDCGPLKPFSGQHAFPPNVLEESDTLAGAAKLLPQINQDSQMKGVDLLVDTIQKSRQPVTILAIGPLTNIAAALQQAPEIKNHIQAIYIMGGAVNVPGNLSEAGVKMSNKTAEWNFYIDPIAASIVMNQSIPIMLIPLDVTNTASIDMTFYNRLKKNHSTPAANFVYTLLTNNMKMLTDKRWYFWDPLSAVIASDESVAAFKFQPISVSLMPESHSGRTAINKETGQNIRVAESIDQQRFRDLLINTLNKK